jgi:hypothetical protein
MKKINPQTGGHPFRLDDVIHVQNGLIENSAGLASAFNNGNAIALQGCVVTGINHNVSAGYIYYNNEIFKVPATSVGVFVFGNSIYWKIVEVTEPVTLATGYTVQYQDLSFKGVHLRRTMIPFQNNGTSPDIVFSDAALPRLPSIYSKFSSLDATNTTQTTNITTNTNAIADINAAWTDVPINTLTFQVYDSIANAYTTIPLSVTNTSIGASTIPTGTSCYFRYKKIGKTVLVNWLFQFSWTMVNTQSNDKFRLTLPAAISSNAKVVVQEHNIYHNAANGFPAGKFTSSLHGGVIDLFCNAQSNGVKYSGAAFNFAYDLSLYGTGGITHISSGHAEYEIT